MTILFTVLMLAVPNDVPAVRGDDVPPVRTPTTTTIPTAPPVRTNDCQCSPVCKCTGLGGCCCGTKCESTTSPQEIPRVLWRDYGEALALAKGPIKKKLLVEFRSEICPWCDKLEKEVLQDPTVVNLLNTDYVCLRVIDGRYKSDVSDYMGVVRYPTIIICNSEATELRRMEGYAPKQVLLNHLTSVFSTKSVAPISRFPVGHTHTCSHGHTWDHTITSSHNCPVCGTTVYRQDPQPRMVNVVPSIQSPSFQPHPQPLFSFNSPRPTARMSGCSSGG